jgi:exopolysaccharide production protein ExoQ
VDRGVVSLLIIFAIVALARRKLPWGAMVEKNRLILFYAFYCLLSILWSDYPFVALKRWIQFAGLIPCVFIVLSEESPADAAAAVIRRCTYLLVAISFLLVRYYPAFGRYYNRWTYETGYSGVTTNKNELGLLCIVAMVILLSDLAEKWYERKRVFISLDILLWLVMLLIALYLTNISHSATSTLCIIVGASIILISYLPSSRRNPTSAARWVAGVALFSGFLQVTLNLKDLIFAALGRNPTLTGRTDLWKFLLSMGTNPIFGTGFESFWNSTRLSLIWSSGFLALQSHNGYIDTYLNLGLVGVLFFAALMLRCYLMIDYKVEKDHRANQLRLAFVVIYALYNWTEAAFPRPGLLMFVFLIFTLRGPQLQEKRVLSLPASERRMS